MCAFRNSAHAVRNGKAGIPHQLNKLFDAETNGFRWRAVKQDEQVDIGAGVQLAAPVTADGNQPRWLGVRRHQAAPDPQQEPVDECRAGMQ